MDRKSLREFTHRADNFLEIGNLNYKQWVFRYTFLELEKDLGSMGDVTSECLIDRNLRVKAVILAKDDGLLAGRQEIEYFLIGSDSQFKPRLNDNFNLDFKFADGENFKKGEVLVEIEGNARDILAVERVILNILMRMSAVASNTSRIVQQLSEYDVLITPTRKTLWGLLDKRAVVLGGGGTHRINLADAILVKDNHIKLLGSNFEKLFETLAACSQECRFVEIEVENFGDAMKVCEFFDGFGDALSNVGCLLLDNMRPEEIQLVILEAKKRIFYDEILFEASGGISELNAIDYAKTGVDIISMGALTNVVKGLDMSLEIV